MNHNVKLSRNAFLYISLTHSGAHGTYIFPLVTRMLTLELKMFPVSMSHSMAHRLDVLQGLCGSFRLRCYNAKGNVFRRTLEIAALKRDDGQTVNRVQQLFFKTQIAGPTAVLSFLLLFNIQYFAILFIYEALCPETNFVKNILRISCGPFASSLYLFIFTTFSEGNMLIKMFFNKYAFFCFHYDDVQCNIKSCFSKRFQIDNVCMHLLTSPA